MWLLVEKTRNRFTNSDCTIGSFQVSEVFWGEAILFAGSRLESVTRSGNALEISSPRGNGFFSRYHIEEPALYPHGGFELFVRVKEV